MMTLVGLIEVITDRSLEKPDINETTPATLVSQPLDAQPRADRSTTAQATVGSRGLSPLAGSRGSAPGLALPLFRPFARYPRAGG